RDDRAGGRVEARTGAAGRGAEAIGGLERERARARRGQAVAGAGAGVVAVRIARRTGLAGARGGDDLVGQAVILERLAEFMADGAEGIDREIVAEVVSGV